MGTPQRYIEIKDFSPGIYGDLHGYSGANAMAHIANSSAVGIQANGAATIKDTYGCHADGSGALTPLPLGVKASNLAASTFGGTGDTAPTYYPTNRVGTYLMDAIPLGFVVDEDAAATPITKVAMIYGTWYDPTHTGTFKQYMWIVIADLDLGAAGAEWATVLWGRHGPAYTPQTDYSIMAGSLWHVRALQGYRDSAGFLRYDINAVVNAFGYVMHGNPVPLPAPDEYMNWATGAIPGAETALTNFTTVTATTTYPNSLNSASGVACPGVGVFPDPSNINSGKPRVVTSVDTIPGFIGIGHQGRSIVSVHTSRQFGDNKATTFFRYYWQDRVFYSPVYDPGLASDVTDNTINYFPASYTSSIAGDDNLNLIGTMGSISASEMLIVKHDGGGILMRGDMDNFEALSLPFIESTYGLIHHGVSTPIGFVYGSINGVHVWNGGQTSEELSKQIDGFFWNHAIDANGNDIPYRGNRGRFGWWTPYVAVPNNFLYDTHGKAWWRLDLPAATDQACNVYRVDPSTGNLIAFPHKYAPGVTPAWYVYDPDVLRSTYGWRSQPLVESLDKLQVYEDIELYITTAYPFTGGQTITVTLEGIDGEGRLVASRPIAFVPVTGSVAYPMHVIKKQITSGDPLVQGSFTARYVQVKIAVTGGSGPAPKIHAIKIGVHDGQSVPITQ